MNNFLIKHADAFSNNHKTSPHFKKTLYKVFSFVNYIWQIKKHANALRVEHLAW